MIKLKSSLQTNNRIWLVFIMNISLVIVIFITGIFIGLIFRNNRLINNEIFFLARSYFTNIVLTRRWNANYGGVYVEKKEGVKSNPYLDNPEIETIDGKIYTKKNPALMTREISEYAEKEGLFKFHITSLNPLNPNNQPHEWEKIALKKFQAGEIEYYKNQEEGNTIYFLYMAPLKVEKSCLACHAKQGYKIGDIRGGISIKFDISNIKNSIKWQNNLIIILGLFSIGVLLGIIYLFVIKLNKTLNRAYKKIENMAITDDLMQIKNRRYFFNRLEEEFNRSKRYKNPIGIILMDIDHFKLINDNYGHQMGDKVLKDISKLIKRICRNTDIVARYGGEEIILLLPNTNEKGTLDTAEKIRVIIEQESIDVDMNNKINITASFGIISISAEKIDTIDNYDILIQLSDKALYKAKQNGRNRVEVASLPTEK